MVKATEDKTHWRGVQDPGQHGPQPPGPHCLHARGSGKLTRGMRTKIVRTGKSLALNAPQFFFAQDRSLAEEAFAGDVVGIPNHGVLRIGDTLTEGEDVVFTGVPNFAPEILRRVKLADPMKAKKLKEALEQLAEEGVVQLFTPMDGSGAIVGVVGALQLDVLISRLDAEYGVPVDFETTRFDVLRWLSCDDAKTLDTLSMAIDLPSPWISMVRR